MNTHIRISNTFYKSNQNILNMKLPVNLLDLNTEQFSQFLDSFDHIFSDCDGVIWKHEALPRVGEFFGVMKKHGKTVNYVSNNSLRSKEIYELRFKEAKIENGFENLLTPSVAISEYLKSVNFNKKVYSVSCLETTKMIRSYGFECKEGPDVGVDYYEDYIQYLADDEEIGAVVFDSDVKVNMPKILKAITYLKRPEVLFLSGATDRHMNLKSGLALGTGVFTEIAIKESNREPILLGKPGKLFGAVAMKKAGVTDPSRVLFIGDMLAQDIGLGKALGFKTLLVLTNVSKKVMFAQDKLKPDYYAESLGSVVPLF